MPGAEDELRPVHQETLEHIAKANGEAKRALADLLRRLSLSKARLRRRAVCQEFSRNPDTDLR
jgi:hypothetical protein